MRDIHLIEIKPLDSWTLNGDWIWQSDIDVTDLVVVVRHL